MADSRRLELETRAAQRLRETLLAEHADDPELIADMVEAETGLLEAIEVAALRLHAIEGDIEGGEISAAKLAARQKRRKTTRDNLRAAIQAAMEVAEKTKIITSVATLSVRAGAPKVVIVEQSLIPPIYWTRPDPVLDMRALAEAVKDGEAIPGAILSNAAPALSVRFK
jgi:hypothetical protein